VCVFCLTDDLLKDGVSGSGRGGGSAAGTLFSNISVSEEWKHDPLVKFAGEQSDPHAACEEVRFYSRPKVH